VRMFHVLVASFTLKGGVGWAKRAGSGWVMLARRTGFFKRT